MQSLKELIVPLVMNHAMLQKKMPQLEKGTFH
jgi:hypothetical protein